jgi:outer membrane protein assembly factor BamB
VSGIFPVNGYLLFTSHDNFAYRISTGNGSVTWKRRLSGRAEYVSVIDEHFAIVAASDDHGAVIIDLKNGKTAGQITLDADESIVDAPVLSNGNIFILGSRAVRSYSLKGCEGKKEGGLPTNESGKTAIQKN